jgi:AmmeMemoRadiSam system protein A
MIQASEPSVLSDVHQKELLRLARLTIAAYLETGYIPHYETGEPALTRCAGAFVTLRNRYILFDVAPDKSLFSLRGCIGYIQTDRPLYQVIQGMAIAAATSDPRLPPVTIEELPEIHIEISILSPLQLVADLEQIQVGLHGLMLVHEKQRGVLLPQVPVERGWSRQEFLEHLCLKAGLPTNYWTDERSRFYLFTTVIIEEQ